MRKGLLCAAFLALVGCSSDSSSSKDTGPTGDGTVKSDTKTGDGPVADTKTNVDVKTGDLPIITDSVSGDAPTMTTVTGKIVDQDDQPVDGATVSIEGTTNSVTTTTAGTFSLSAGEGTTIFIRATKTGLIGALRGLVVPEGGETDVELILLSTTDMDDALTEAGLPARKTTHGLVAVEFDTASVGGQKATLSQTNDGAFVYNSAGDAVKGDTLLTGGEPIVTFDNVAVGTTTVTVTGTNCALAEAITSYPVVANLRTIIDVACQ